MGAFEKGTFEKGVKEFNRFLVKQGKLLSSEHPEDADIPLISYEVVVALWEAVVRANPVGLRAPTVEVAYLIDEGEDEIHTALDWSRGRAWFWIKVDERGQCSTCYRNFATDEETFYWWQPLSEALPPFLDLLFTHLAQSLEVGD